MFKMQKRIPNFPAATHDHAHVPYQRTHYHKRYPIPRGNSSYAEAKRAEYIAKDLDKAEQLYLQEIQHGERKESAVKDLAVIYHQ
jgi:hypothetical protein